MNEIKNRLQPIFQSVFEDQTIEISEQTSPEHISRWDSLHHVLLISEIEKEFETEFSLEELTGFTTVGDIIKALKVKVDGA